MRRTRPNAGEENSGCVRYFLAKANGDGSTPALDREVATQREALVEALRLGATYYAIQEFRVIPDFAGGGRNYKRSRSQQMDPACLPILMLAS